MVFPITATPIPCLASARLGSVDQVLVARLYARTVLNTLRASSPPKVISWPPTTAAPRSLSAVGRRGQWVPLPGRRVKALHRIVIRGGVGGAPADGVQVGPIRHGRQVIARD